ncbi:MAG: hypothetical protein PQJ60_13225, partial [Spirochaetales bacterium]|nr:hypothetical protein [Spirochaetales bacterium]
MLEKLEELQREFRKSVEDLKDQNSLAEFKADYLGKKGKLNDILKGMREASADVKKSVGAKANEFKQEIQESLNKQLQKIETAEVNAKLAKSWQDITLTDAVQAQGLRSAGFHPVTLIQREIEDIFISMGFDILDGPHIEDDFHNFGALNIPETHPARDMQDTFWFADMEHLLRTHTSTIQVRGM